ncbi:MAG: GtrA family protein [Bacteroidales bacterium]|nr:GtrA family protein [Bacteroidales bacterium]
MVHVLLRYIRFLGASTAGTVTDMFLLWLLSDVVFPGGYWREYILSPVLSFQCAVLVNYTIFYFYVWKDRVASWRSPIFFLKRYLRYNLSCSTVFLFRFGAMLLIERFTGWDVIVCSLLAMCVSGIINFILTNNLVFRKK